MTPNGPSIYPNKVLLLEYAKSWFQTAAAEQVADDWYLNIRLATCLVVVEMHMRCPVSIAIIHGNNESRIYEITP